MPNLVLEGSARMPYFTDMRLVFEALPGVCAGHDWLVSDLECIWLTSDDEDEPLTPDPPLASSPALVTGTDLDRILHSRNIQFVWAVFSALPVGSRPEKFEAPYADCNPQFWYGSPRPQLADAEFEIVCWDSTCCLLIGVSEELAAQFREAFPEVLDLDQQNQSLSRKPSP